MSEPKPRVRTLAGWPAAAHRFCFQASMLRYLLHPRRYPLFVVAASRGGVRRTVAVARAMCLDKVPRLGWHSYPNLVFPRWPSPAFDRMVARGGLNLDAAGTPLKRQVDMVFLAVTRECGYGCRHCYERASLGADEEVPVDRWIEVLADLQASGVSIVVLTGGEPMRRLDRVLAILAAGRRDLSDFHLHTSGDGVTPENARGLAAAGLVAAGIGLDDHDRDRHDRFRGRRGAFDAACAAVSSFRDAGVFTYLNTCLRSELVAGDGLARHLALARRLGTGIVRYLEPKPAGALFDGGAAGLLSDTDRERARRFVAHANHSREHRRDPLVEYDALAEAPGQLGCGLGALSLFSIDGRGNVLPCVFVPVSFGNVLREGFAVALERMRRWTPSAARSGCAAERLHGVLSRRRAEGAELPVPVEAIADEWESLFRPSAVAGGPTS